MKITAIANHPTKFENDNKMKKRLNISGIENNGKGSESEEEDNICSKVAIKKSVKYFLENTTLHGLKYIAEDEITIPERVFFGMSFVVVVALSAIFISNVYSKWSASPIIITTGAKQILITEIPFPAITICSLNLALKSKVEKIQQDSPNHFLLMSLCDQASEITMSYKGAWRYFKELLIEVSQPCDRMLLYCSFGAKTENCSLIFNSVLTDDGLCCTFNALDPKFLIRNLSDDNRFSPTVDNHFIAMNWTPEKGFEGDLPDYYYPRVSGGTGSRMGLTVILNASSKEYYCTKSKSIGFKVLVHNPAELPKISNYGFLVTAGREARVPMDPIYQDAVADLRSIKKQVRRCLFSDEGDLSYYSIYSRKNCELECEAKILQERCECVLYYLPLIDPQTRICGPNDNNCTNQVQTEIESAGTNISCADCLPACFELTYKATLTSTSIVYGAFQSADDFPRNIFNNTDEVPDLSIIHFYYLSNSFRSTTKSQMFGFTEFLSNTGGLLGLFMGFSVFSLIEILYYLTIRPYCANRAMEIRRRKRREQIKWLTPVKRKSYRPELNHHNNLYNSTRKPWAHENYKSSLHQILWNQTKSSRYDQPLYPYLN